MVPPQSSRPSVQFLSNLLTQRGPNALPYEEDAKWMIRQHLVSLTQEFPSLEVGVSLYNHVDGTSAHLIHAEGTVPMHYHKAVYNIPVNIWLLESYPKAPPCVYVTPTRDMIIKRSHPFVDASGVVSIPYLQGWVFPSSNLVELVRNLSIVFGQDPPLYTKSSASNPAKSSASSSSTGSSHSVMAHPSPLGRFFPFGSNKLPQSLPTPSPPPRNTDNPTDVFRRNSINKLVEMLHRDMTELRSKTELEMDKLFNLQGTLRMREEQLGEGLKEMNNEKESLEQQLQMMLTNTDVLETWLSKNEDKIKNDLDIDQVFQPSDTLSTQILESSSSDFAIEDVLYSLDRAVQEGHIPVDSYLRSVRVLSREQFYHRAIASKARVYQTRSHFPVMAAQASS